MSENSGHDPRQPRRARDDLEQHKLLGQFDLVGIPPVPLGVR